METLGADENPPQGVVVSATVDPGPNAKVGAPGSSIFVKAKDGDLVVGKLYVSLDRSKFKSAGDPVATVIAIRVVDDYRRQGIATRLYQLAAEEAAKLGMRLASDNVRSDMAESFWTKQESKGRARRVADRFVLNDMPPVTLNPPLFFGCRTVYSSTHENTPAGKPINELNHVDFLAAVGHKNWKEIKRRYQITRFLGQGGSALAFLCATGRVLKITRDEEDAYASEDRRALAGQPDVDAILAHVYAVGKFSGKILKRGASPSDSASLVWNFAAPKHRDLFCAGKLDFEGLLKKERDKRAWATQPYTFYLIEAEALYPTTVKFVSSKWYDRKLVLLDEVSRKLGIDLTTDASVANFGLRVDGDDSTAVLLDFGYSGASEVPVPETLTNDGGNGYPFGNPLTGVESHGVLVRGQQNLREAQRTSSPTRAAFEAGKARARGQVVATHGPTLMRPTAQQLAQDGQQVAQLASRVHGNPDPRACERCGKPDDRRTHTVTHGRRVCVECYHALQAGEPWDAYYSNPDEDRRALERRAASGDPAAQLRLARMADRGELPAPTQHASKLLSLSTSDQREVEKAKAWIERKWRNWHDVPHFTKADALQLFFCTAAVRALATKLKVLPDNQKWWTVGLESGEAKVTMVPYHDQAAPVVAAGGVFVSSSYEGGHVFDTAWNARGTNVYIGPFHRFSHESHEASYSIKRDAATRIAFKLYGFTADGGNDVATCECCGFVFDMRQDGVMLCPPCSEIHGNPSDEERRRLERAARAGDPDAARRMGAAAARGGYSITWQPGKVKIKIEKPAGYDRDRASHLRGEVLRAKQRAKYARDHGDEGRYHAIMRQEVAHFQSQLKAENAKRGRRSAHGELIDAEIAGPWALHPQISGAVHEARDPNWVLTHTGTGLSIMTDSDKERLRRRAELYLLSTGLPFAAKAKKDADQWSVEELIAIGWLRLSGVLGIGGVDNFSRQRTMILGWIWKENARGRRAHAPRVYQLDRALTAPFMQLDDVTDTVVPRPDFNAQQVLAHLRDPMDGQSWV